MSPPNMLEERLVAFTPAVQKDPSSSAQTAHGMGAHHRSSRRRSGNSLGSVAGGMCERLVFAAVSVADGLRVTVARLGAL
jgi:hypothetical protein